MFFRCYSDSENKETDKVTEFSYPPELATRGLRKGFYSKLDPTDGLIFPGTRVTGDDIIIGKVSHLS